MPSALKRDRLDSISSGSGIGSEERRRNTILVFINATTEEEPSEDSGNLLDITKSRLWKQGEEETRRSGKPVYFTQEMLKKKLQEVHLNILKRKEQENMRKVDQMQKKISEQEKEIGKLNAQIERDAKSM